MVYPINATIMPIRRTLKYESVVNMYIKPTKLKKM
jgi:hypothetical protein